MSPSRAIASTGSMLKEKPLLLLIDGHAMVHRAWHAIQQPLNVRRTGEEVRAVYGFLNTFLRTIADWDPTHCAIAFDLAAPTFRHQRFDQYKAQRPETPQELHDQVDRVRQLMEAFSVPILEVEEYEADDVIGTLSSTAEQQGLETLILTGDTDTLQLVSPWVRVLLHYRIQERKVFDVAAVRERYGGLGPAEHPDMKALQGDPSDNIPGVPGIGSKTAVKLLLEFGSIDGIYENIDKVTPEKLRETLKANRELAYEGKTLTTIVRDVPLDVGLDDCIFWRYDRQAVVDFISELEFFTLVSRIPERNVSSESKAAPLVQVEEEAADYKTVRDREALEKLVAELTASGGFAFDTETTSIDPMSADLVGLSFSIAQGSGWYVPVGHEEGKQVPLEEALATLRPLLENAQMPKTAHNANYDLMVLANHGIDVKGVDFDTMVAAHLAGRKGLGLKSLAMDCFRVETTPISELIGTGRNQVTMAQVPSEKASAYACADADFTWRLKGVMEEELKEKGLYDLLGSVEMPLVPVMVRMQLNGVKLETGLLREMGADLGQRLSQLEREVYEVTGHQFNINSSQQLGDVLFKEMRMPQTKRTKTGFSTDASALEFLKHSEDGDPRALELIDLVLSYRELGKLKSTYVDSLPELVNLRTGRVHPSYNQTGSATGRISSNDPNVQNIPVRTELGRQIRKAFVAEGAPHWTLLAADYSQIELRVLAHLSQDPGLLEAFHRDEDIHSATASLVYNVPLVEVTSDMRRVAKVMNFGVIYGLSAFGIAQQTDISRDEGAKFIESYFGKYPGIKVYLESTKAMVRDQGYVETLMKRRRYIPEISSSNFQVRQAAERMAVNMPIQGTAADIFKIAMVRVQQRMDNMGLKSRMIVQVHDELIFEVPQEELEQMRAMLLEEMPSALDLDVPLKVELKSGPTWGDME